MERKEKRERRDYKVRYRVGKGEIEIEWEREFKIDEKKRNIIRTIERYEITEKQEEIIKILADGKEHSIKELERESRIESIEGVIAVINSINRKIESSSINKGIKERGKKRKIIERIGYSRYLVKCEIEVE